ncbi:MAG: CAP domain-containing protein [Bacteroidales bacterium]|nr:CAP domain-containing protein [Bacteroidales bacterium]
MKKNLMILALFLFTIGIASISSCKKDDTDDDKDDDSNLTELEKAQKDYKDNFLSTKATGLSWTGAVAGCGAGDIDAAVRNNVITRINYFRRLVGLPDNVTLNSSQNQKCQEGALYMAANKTITHYPSTSGSCYTDGAYASANHGNVAISYGGGSSELGGNHSTSAVSGYVEDPGPNNTVVGHRHWILAPTLSAMGTGSVFSAAQNNFSANVLMWGDNLNGEALATDKYVAYPPNGYIPSSLLYPRWSFSIPSANFNNATVTLKDQNGATINANVIEKITFMGKPDSRIVWEPAGIITNTDAEYTVTVSGIGGAAQTSYTYTVKSFRVEQTAKRTSGNEVVREFLSL